MDYYYTKDWQKKFTKAIDFFFPMSTYCICCGNFINETRNYSLCDKCIKEVSFDFYYIDLRKEEKDLSTTFPLDSVYVASKYNIYSKEMVTTFKYKNRTYIARVLSNILIDRVLNDEELSEKVLNCDMVIPVPISKERLKERGFNQTEKIGKYFTKSLGLTMVNAIERIKDTVPQKDIKGEEREKNVENSFELKCDVRGKSIVILDDIYTTGATLKAISKILKEGGAKEIIGLCTLSRNKYLKKDIL